MPGANEVLGCPQVQNFVSINSSAKISDNLFLIYFYNSPPKNSDDRFLDFSLKF